MEWTYGEWNQQQQLYKKKKDKRVQQMTYVKEFAAKAFKH